MAAALMWSWAPSTLATYRARLQALATRETSMAPGAALGDVVETVLLESLAAGRTAGTLRSLLSAVQCTITLGIAPLALPHTWWRLSPASARLAITPAQPRTWFTVETLVHMATGALTTTEAITIGLTYLSLALGLRVGEAARLARHDLWLPTDPAQATIRLHPEKQRPTHATVVFRTPPQFILAWAAFLQRVSPGPPDTPFLPLGLLSSTFRGLQAPHGTPFPFHALRRACAAHMFAAGHPVAHIASWCRWRSQPMAEHYIGTGPSCPLGPYTLPGPPTGPSPPFHCILHQADWTCIWPPIPHTTDPPSAPRPRRQKRPRQAE